MFYDNSEEVFPNWWDALDGKSESGPAGDTCLADHGGGRQVDRDGVVLQAGSSEAVDPVVREIREIREIREKVPRNWITVLSLLTVIAIPFPDSTNHMSARRARRVSRRRPKCRDCPPDTTAM